MFFIKYAETDTYLHLNRTQGFLGFWGTYSNVLEVDQVFCINLQLKKWLIYRHTDCKRKTTKKTIEQNNKVLRRLLDCFFPLFLLWRRYPEKDPFETMGSLRASSPGHHGGEVGKGRRAYNYVSGI